MRILYLCHRIPNPPNKGDKLRAHYQLRLLGARHRIHLLTLADRPEDAPYAEGLREFCEEVEVFQIQRADGYLRAAAGIFRSRPLTLAFFHSDELRRRVEVLARGGGYDVVLTYSSAMAPYAEAFAGIPKVLDMVDVDSVKWEQFSHFSGFPTRLVYALEARRLRAYEAALCARFDRIVLATSQESELLASRAPQARPVTVPNGVEVRFFTGLDLPKSSNPVLVFTGQMDYFPNADAVIHFGRTVFPQLRQRFPELEFLVVGRSPTPRVRALGEIPGIFVTGTVEDVRPFLARSWVFVAPLRITQGIQNKVLEAMACGLPVVCTERVLRGLADGGVRAGEEVLAAADDRELGEQVAALLGSAELRERIGRAGKASLAEAHTWEPNIRRLETVLREAVSERRRRGVVRPYPGPQAGGSASPHGEAESA